MRRSVGWLLVVVGALLGGACAGGEPNPLSTFSVGPGSPTPTEEPTSPAASPTPGPTATTTATPRPPAPASPAPPAPAPPASPAGPAGRNERLGQPFLIRVGETVGIAGEDLVVTYSQLLSDNRCPLGVQCITAGNARITVVAGTDSSASVILTLNTDDRPRSATYLDYTVELVSLARGSRPTATLRVT